MILEKIKQIQDAPIEVLSDQTKLSNLICQMGLFFKITPDMPASFHPYCDQGLRIFQSPYQLAQYLIKIKDYPISNYAEIGLASGGTFIFTMEYLKRFNKDITGVGIDPYLNKVIAETCTDDIVMKYGAMSENVEIIQKRSWDVPEKLANVDLVMIDGNHAFKAVIKDFDLVKKTSKIIVFHDILQIHDVITAWALIKQENNEEFDFHECNYLLPSDYAEMTPKINFPTFGIGLAIRKNLPDRRN